jgi:hypothetical protein
LRSTFRVRGSGRVEVGAARHISISPDGERA